MKLNLCGSFRVDTDRIWKDFERLVVKTCIAIAPELKVEFRAEIPPGKPGPNPFQVRACRGQGQSPRSLDCAHKVAKNIQKAGRNSVLSIG